MLFKNIMSPILFGLVLIGCSGGGATQSDEQASLKIQCDEANGIQGCWEPVDCDEVDSEEANAEAIYGRNIYSFRSTGNIQLEVRSYITSDCTGEIASSLLIDWSETYFVGEEVLANDGTPSRELFVRRLVDGFLVQDTTIFAILNDNQLCTTDYLQLLPSQRIIGETQNESDLNYENCLLRF